MKTIAKLIGIFALLSLLSACGGGSNGASFTSGGTGGSSGGGGTSTTPTGITLTLTSNLATVSPGGSTGLIASIADNTGAPYTTPVPVTFSSTCTGNSLATITSPVTTNNGVANTTYTDSGCGITDTIRATAIVAGVTLTKSTTVSVTPSTVGSIEFVSATPTTISIQGTGGSGLSETSIVVFKVKNSSGGPRFNAGVTFSLSTTVGGITLSTLTGTSDTNGLVTTVVKSGTIHTAVWVTATVTGTSIATQSSKLDISTGIPDQNSISLSLEKLNPEAYEYDGVVDAVTVYAADHFNNPAPDGTTIAFSTEGGQIGSSCQTTAGHCTVNWTSSNPRPTTDGRVTIMASAIGEESFTDLNGNGFYDSGEPFTDLPEAFRDDNESGSYDGASEEYIDFNTNGTYDAANGLYIGSLCKSNCDPSATSLSIFKNIVLVMGSSNQTITISPSPINLLADGTVQLVTITVKDARNQPPPAGTVVSISTTNGKLLGDTSFTATDTNTAGPYTVLVNMQTDGTAGAGVLTVKATTPKGLINIKTANVNDL